MNREEQIEKMKDEMMEKLIAEKEMEWKRKLDSGEFTPYDLLFGKPAQERLEKRKKMEELIKQRQRQK